MKTLALAAVLAVATLGAAAPAANAQPYWGYRHGYGGPHRYWGYGYGPYWRGGYGPGYGYGPYWRPHRCYYGYRCW